MALHKQKKVVLLVGAAIILFFLVVIGFRISQSKLFAKPKMFEPPPIPVVMAPAQMGEILMTLTYPGDLHGEREATVYSLVTGRVVSYNHREGDAVEKGETVVVLEREEKWNKYKPVLIAAPLSGRIAEVYLEVGGYATPQTPLCLIIGGKSIRADLHIPDPELLSIRPGMEAFLSVPTIPEKTFSGSVTNISPFIASGTRTGEVEVSFDNNDASLLPGMFGDVTIVIERKDNAVVIPIAAILYEGDGLSMPYVFVINGDIVSKRSVELGIREVERAEVILGLVAGENVVTTGKENLSEGTRVMVVEDE